MYLGRQRFRPESNRCRYNNLKQINFKSVKVILKSVLLLFFGASFINDQWCDHGLSRHFKDILKNWKTKQLYIKTNKIFDDDLQIRKQKLDNRWPFLLCRLFIFCSGITSLNWKWMRKNRKWCSLYSPFSPRETLRFLCTSAVQQVYTTCDIILLIVWNNIKMLLLLLLF
jgi:hypothetical protein